MLTARILFDRIRGTAQTVLLALVLATPLSIAGVTVAAAANTNCVVNGTTADCPDVPTDGISYTSGVKTVNVGDGTVGSTAVVPSGTIGINLRETGVDRNDPAIVISYDNVIQYDVDPGSGETLWYVLADAQGVPILANGEYIHRTNDNPVTFAINGVTIGNAAALAQHLQGITTNNGGSVSGSLTVNNPGTGSAASFSTTNADGIHVESRGGNGGNGGCTTILLATWCDSGDSGGGAGTVAVNNDGTIVVNGTGYGVSATSVGGTGGNGGGSFGLFASDAGSGGNGGNGADVNVMLGTNSNITTWGDGGHGVYAVSNGGNGGAGGSPSGAVALGDSGGSGGDAGQVTVTNNGAITTHGAKAYGIFAQSMGAGAGSGSSSGGIVAIGGNGGGESSGNKVTVSNSGSIETWGVDSFGILAQSIGGGGGDGGSSGGLFAVGGRGGSGGGSDIVKVFNSGTITTHSSGSAGIFAQSVGGGGGNGGNAYSGSVGVSVAIGGNGGLGGAGGKVIVNELGVGQTLADLDIGNISTGGERSHGIQAQSIGGGGGNGGFAVAASIGQGFSLNFALGGSGAKGGSADTVTVNEKGHITTTGNQANGIFAQSVGGGGGSGGGAVAAGISTGYTLNLAMGGSGAEAGHGSTVTVNAMGGIDTTGDMAHGILAQSLGGGGGNGGYSVAGGAGSLTASVGLGGSGAGGGNGGTVTVNLSGIGNTDNTVHTRGNASHGIFAQSVGGGGGSGGFAVAAGIGGGAISVSLGGSGGGGGLGGTVGVTNSDTLLTDGKGSYGILAQSIGGGGGNGGFSFAGAAGVMAASVAVGGNGGSGNNGGAVTVDNLGNVTTLGDLSFGVLAQSIGGGGGNGGGAVAATMVISVPDVPAIGASVAIGGAGGTASLGGHVILNNDGSITTGTKTVTNAGTPTETITRTGNGAHALFAQSVGGGGGTGGFAGAGTLSIGNGASFAVAVGGRGGSGGDAGVVELTNTGDAIHTWGDGADGIHAQSVGGGGGDGGFGLALAASIGGAEMTNISVAVAIGGKGGAGGTGNTVTIDNSGAITTDGAKSNGIFAQSIGGGGGTGGFAATGTVTVSETAAGIGVSVGGGGGTGNFAQKVAVDNSGAITTYGKESLGILAQSIGGGGGNGGLSVVAQIGISTGDSAQIGVSIGGAGSTGSYGGEVDIGNLADGDITTYGFGSHGILAQSIGGGGGKGGLAVYGGLSLSGEGTTMNAGVSVGGNGGTGGYGNTVTVVNDGGIRVVGDNAMGVVAQSIGGGGGDGGGSIAAMLGVTNVTNVDAATYQAVVSVGGVGGSGNYGGAVNVTNSGSIVTGSMTVDGKTISGLGGTGIFAQSVGGGGGIGGRANAINIVAGPKCSLPVICTAAENQGNNMALTATVGGNGGTAGHGGIVTVVNTGEIVTIGDTADGIFAQSIGGGGGTGGNGILGTGELLPVPVELLFIPVGQTAIYKDISVAVGGNAGASGNGALVDVKNSKNITTLGDYSNGIFAQSVGGGGGVGGKAVIGATGKIGVGGEGGASGNGGDVKVANTTGAVIETFGVASMGIFAQSVGGGGGMAGAVDRALAAGLDTPLGHLPVNLGIGLAFGQGGGGGGDGGVVDVDVTGAVLTHGDGATGIFAQSVGGGGGVLGGLGNDLPVLNLLSWHVGSNGDAGNAGVVTVDMDGMVATAGNAATGIFAQSTGGGGTASDVTVTVDGSVLTAAIFAGHENDPLRGYGSVGIMAQSAGWGGNGDVTVNLDSATGLVSGGRSGLVLIDGSDPDHLKYADYKGIGILIVDGKDNTVTNKGTITTADGVDAGWAILAGGSDPENATVGKQQKGGNEAISNFGTVTGSVDLGIGTNSFVNETTGTFNSGHFAIFGDGNLLTNDGWMSTGGKNRVMTTAVNGNMVQSASGTYGVDIDLAKSHLSPDPALEGEADLIDVDGTLEMLGEVDLTLLNMGNALPGDHQVTIAKSAVGLTGTPTLTAPASIVATYALSQTETELLLNYGIDFDVEGLNPNQSAIGEYVNAVQLAGGSDALEPVVASLFQIPDLETYQATLDQLSPEPYLINETLAMLASLQFENSLMSCKVQDSVDAEGQCAWAAVNHRKTERSETDTNLSFEQTSFGLSAGAQARIDEHFVAGIGGSWEDIGTESNDTGSSTGNRFQGGAVFKGVWGNTVLAGAITGGWSSQNVSRFVDMPLGPSYVLEGTQDIGFASAHVRLSHSIEQDNWYVRPMIDVGVTQVSIADFSETGGPVALEIQGHDETYVTVAPSIEVGGEMDLGDDAILRSFLRVGALDVVLGTNPQISAGFVGAPDGVDPFTITGDIDDALFDVTLGFDVIANNGATFRLTGDAKVGETVKSYGGSMKISAPF